MSEIPRLDLHVKSGDTFMRTISLTDGNGDPINLGGATVEFAIAVSPGGSPNFYYNSDDDPYFTINAVGGEIEVEIPMSETVKWGRSRYMYDFRVTDLLDRRLTYFTGTLFVSAAAVQ